jgi:ABC-2 type transport system ATP-binding protein
MTQMDADAVRLAAVTKRYGQVTAVRELALDIPRGQTVALLGPNGAGKSTTIGMMLGLVRPDAGMVEVAGRAPRRAVAEGRIAAMLQDAGMMPGVTVGERVGLGHRAYPRPLPTGEALELAGLTGLAGRRVDKLSGGQAQRLRFALAVVANPEILVLDEPTRALDVAGRTEFWRSMRGYAQTGRTLLFATHYLDEVDEHAQRVVMLVGGRVVADGTPAEIRRVAGTSTVRFALPSAEPGADGADDGPAGLPGVVRVEAHAGVVTLHTTEPDATVRALAAGTLPWRDIQVSPASLDESFLKLTETPMEASR